MPHTTNHHFIQHITVEAPDERASHLFAKRLQEIHADVSDSRIEALKQLSRKHANSVSVTTFACDKGLAIRFTTDSPTRTVEKRLRRAFLHVLDIFTRDIPIMCPFEKEDGATLVPYRTQGFNGDRLNRRKV